MEIEIGFYFTQVLWKKQMEEKKQQVKKVWRKLWSVKKAQEMDARQSAQKICFFCLCFLLREEKTFLFQWF